VIVRGEFEEIDREVLDRIEAAVRAAKAEPLPTAADLLTDVYVSY
jgi:pyruvate dehydrogenase E1 component alpha subunit